MHRRDLAVIAGLTAILVAVALSLGLPSAIAPAAPPTAQPLATGQVRPYVEGVVGPLDQVSPLSARTQAERNAVALVFSGLVKLGPDQTIVPDLADTWDVDPSGAHWTFHIRSDATWHDGIAVTAEDVAFTVRTLRSADYRGPGAASWKEVTVTVVDRLTVRFDLTTPLGGFLQAATQPLVPAHILDGVSAQALSSATSPFGRQPIGSGPYRLVTLVPGLVRLVPVTRTHAASTAAPGAGGSPTPPIDALRTDSPPLVPPRPASVLTGFEFRVYDTAASLVQAYRNGELDAASGLTPVQDADLLGVAGTRLVRYPGTTLLVIVLNLRRTHPEFRDPNVRKALLSAIDRDGIVNTALWGFALRADGLIPPSSWAFDPTVNQPIALDATGAAAALQKAGWTRTDTSWKVPGVADPLAIDLLSADAASNPTAFAVADEVASDWRQLGLATTHTGLAPADLSTTRLQVGDFGAVLLSVNIGLDPDLYPLLASTQTVTTGSNFAGLQDAGLDKLLTAARAPGAVDARKAAYSALQKQLAIGTYMLPLAFRDVVVVVSDRVTGPVARAVSDPADRFWDVLTWRLAVGRT
jgi:peptide/nickel transport system substrate-binding protein